VILFDFLVFEQDAIEWFLDFGKEIWVFIIFGAAGILGLTSKIFIGYMTNLDLLSAMIS
jgi:hypothetical protein